MIFEEILNRGPNVENWSFPFAMFNIHTNVVHKIIISWTFENFLKSDF
jgi:hypothetical protein